MNRGINLKRKLERIAVFGANARIGGKVAEHIAGKSPDTILRLVVRSESYREELAKKFPNAEIAIADYYDLASLELALQGANGVFVVTPDFLDEERAMTNLIYALRNAGGSVRHIVRLLADPPGMTIERVPDFMKAFGGGTTVQHLKAKKVLEASGLPITYINIAAYFMQNFTDHLFNPGLRMDRVLSCPHNRRMAFIDTTDIGKCAGAILLSENHRHIGQTYHLDNGNDVMWFDEVADVMTEVWGEKVTYDDSEETFVKYAKVGFAAEDWHNEITGFLIGYFAFEQNNETVWRKSDICEFLTGGPGKTFADWLRENREAILGA